MTFGSYKERVIGISKDEFQEDNRIMSVNEVFVILSAFDKDKA